MSEHLKLMKRMRAKHPGCACENCVHGLPFTVIPGFGSQCAETTRSCAVHGFAVGAEYVCGKWRPA